MNLYKLYKFGKVIAEGTLSQIAKELNVNKGGLRNSQKNTGFSSRKLVYAGKEKPKNNQRFIKDKKVYALYKGDDYVDMGTLEELSQRQCISRKNLQYYKMPAYRRRRPNGRRLVEVDIDDD